MEEGKSLTHVLNNILYNSRPLVLESSKHLPLDRSYLRLIIPVSSLKDTQSTGDKEHVHLLGNGNNLIIFPALWYNFLSLLGVIQM